MIESILLDKRPITSIVSDQGRLLFRVGEGSITKIEAYGEPGQMAKVPWIAIYEGEKGIVCKMDATGMRLYYR